MPIDLDRMTNDPTYEHYAYRPRQHRRTVIIPWWLVLGAIALLVLCFR